MGMMSYRQVGGWVAGVCLIGVVANVTAEAPARRTADRPEVVYLEDETVIVGKAPRVGATC